MQFPGIRLRHSALVAVIATFTVVVLSGCSIQEQKSADNKEKKVEIRTPFGDMRVNDSKNKQVDIRTPFGQMNVNTDVNVADTGLPVYPGARRAIETDHDKNAANVNISAGPFGLRVVAIKFDTDASPDQVLAFYRDKVKAYGGTFLECRDTHFSVHTHDEKELTCDDHGGNTVELKAGSPDHQHVVAVKPNGKGSEFTLVYVNKRGKEGEL